MITDLGKTVIVSFFGQQVGQIIDSIALGVGTTTETAADTRLAYEAVRVPVTSVQPDTDNQRAVYKAVLPIGSLYKVYEIGGYSGSALDESRIIDITSPLAVWTNAALNAANSRVHSSALKIDYTTSGTTNAEIIELNEDLTATQGTINLAFHPTANLSSLRVRLGSDSSNYYEFLVASPTNGSYNIHRLNVSSATVTGTPDWSAITYMAIRPSATGGGGGSIYFDSVRFTQTVEDDQLVARKVLASPVTLDPNVDTEIEYSLEIDFL